MGSPFFLLNFTGSLHASLLIGLEEPYNIYSKIAVPLHDHEDYRELGLKRVLCKLGAETVSEGMRATFSKGYMQLHTFSF